MATGTIHFFQDARRNSQFILTRLLTRDTTVNGEPTWLRLAQAAHAVRPFHAIIALSAAGEPGVFFLDDLDKDTLPWKCIATIPVTRDPSTLANHCELLCAEADEISIIDPFYDLCDGRILSALEAFVDVAPPIAKRLQRFNVHLKATELALDPAAFESRCKSRVSSILRSNQRVTVFLWGGALRGDRFHDRHVLTGKGGVVCPGGADGGPMTETTTLSLHSAESRIAELVKFDPMNPAFTLIRQFEVK
jgi:hypothetical protein